MFENFVFSGIGHAYGEYPVSNEMLEKAVKDGRLDGFNEDRVAANEDYLKFLGGNPGISPFEYFAGTAMGFKVRNHVAPFSSTKKKVLEANTAIDLAVKAIDVALKDAGIHPEEIHAWYASTGTPPLQAPGIASLIKAYFTNWDNQTITSTITSACVGFNINLQRAIEFLKCNPEANHVVVVHSEILTSLLTETTDFVPFVTFGDGAAAIVLSRVKSKTKEGLISIVNNEDLRMLDNLGADKSGNLYMNPSNVKRTAIFDIHRSTTEVLKNSNWNTGDIDIFIPHQTGHAIVHGAAKKLGIPIEKTFQEVQVWKGNISGASVPASLSELKQKNILKPGMKIQTSTAGLGGEFGAFSYIIPEKLKIKKNELGLYAGTTALITGATGGLGCEVAINLAKKGCKLVLQYNSNSFKAKELSKELKELKNKFEFIKSDFSNLQEVDSFIKFVSDKYKVIDFVVHTSAITGSLSKASEVSHEEAKMVAQVNQLAPVAITKALFTQVKKAILYVGSVAEDAQFSGSSSYVSSKQGLHGFAASFAAEALSYGIRSIYYMIGVMDGGMAELLSPEQIKQVMLSIGQKKLEGPKETAEKVVNSLTRPKIMGTSDTEEGVLIVRRDGYKKK